MPLQQVSPTAQPAPPPQVQEPLTQVSPAPQEFQQVPQWTVLVPVSTQELPQQVSPPVQPAPLPHWQEPPAQVSFNPQG